VQGEEIFFYIFRSFVFSHACAVMFNIA